MGTPQPLGGGTPSVSAKRSVEQKCGIKIDGTKIGRTKIWWGPIAEQKMVRALSHWVAGGTPSASAKRSAEQKCRIKIGGTKNLMGTHGGTKNGGDPWPLGGRGDP